MRLIFSVAACVAILGACAPAGPVVDIEVETASLRAAADAYHQAAENSDTDALVALDAADVLIFPPNAGEEQGTDGSRRVAEGFTTAPNFEAQFTTRLVKVAASGDLGYTLADATLSFDGPDGETVRDEVRDFHVWEKQEDGSWKVVIDIWNSQLPCPCPVEALE